MANRFHREGAPDFFLSCSGSEKTECGSRDFKLADGRAVQLLLQTVAEGPIYIGRPGFLDQMLEEDVACGACGKAYGPTSVWDPA